MFYRLAILFAVLLAASNLHAQEPSPAQLEQWLKRFPAADTNKDGKLTQEEAAAQWKKLQAWKKRNAAKNTAKKDANPPTHENVKYGPHQRNVFDIWVPKSETPTPLIVFIHGGGFIGGNKEQVRGSQNVQRSLDHGVAFASIQYRFRYPDQGDMTDPERAGIGDILRDSARAIQYLRLHADEYNLDPKRFACYGGSAGAGTSIWLAFHDDLADPQNADPVLQQSTRISAAGMLNGQFTYDLTQWDTEFKDLGGDLIKTHGRDGQISSHRFYGMTSSEFATEVGAKARADADMREMVSSDDPPVFLLTNLANVPVKNRNIYNHHPRHATLVADRCREKGVEAVCLVPKVREEDARKISENPDVMMDFFFKHLGVTKK